MTDQDDGFGPVMRGRASVRRTTTPLHPPRARPEPPGRREVDRPPPRRGAPPPTRKGRRPRRRRPLRTLLLLVLILVLIVVGSGLALAAYASSRIERIPVEGLSSATGMRMNVLVVGSDSREGLTDEEVRELGTGRVGGKRTDTIMVLSVEGSRAAMLSFPRDLYVPRCDGSQGRINAAYNIGDGPSCLVQTVQTISGIPITHYLEMSFLSFVRLVEAVGSVPVCLDAPLQDVSAAIDLPAGCTDLNGQQALGFVRARKVDSDFGRIERQQYFLQQLAGEIASPSTILNVPRLVRTAGAGGETLIADEGFGSLDLIRLAYGARSMAGGGLATHVVPVSPATIGGAAVLVPTAEAEALYASFRDGSALRQPPQPAEATPPA